MASPTISQQIVTLPTTLRLSTCPARRRPASSSASPFCKRFRARPVTIAGLTEEVKVRPWHRPIVPRNCPRSIVGAGAFHDRVREGNGWDHSAKPPGPRLDQMSLAASRGQRPGFTTDAGADEHARTQASSLLCGEEVRRSCRPGVVHENE